MVAGLLVGLSMTFAYVADTEVRTAPTRADTTWRDRGVVVTSLDDDDRKLSWELVVPAPIEDVWAAWTVPDEIATWAAPAADVDLQPGGAWEVHFFPDAPPGERGSDANSIVWFDPGRTIVFAAGAPPQFPTVRREKTEFAVHLYPAGEHHTVVVATQRGFKRGSEWNQAFGYLAVANAQWLNWLHTRFVSGPIDWSTIDLGRNRD